MEAGWNLYEVAKMLDVSYGRIKYQMEFHGLERPKGTFAGKMVFTQTDIDRCRAYFAERKSYSRVTNEQITK